MSHSFDVQNRAWNLLREKLPEDVRFSEVAIRFEFLMESIHEANHRISDAINKDARVTRSAQRLDDAVDNAIREKVL